MKDIKYVFVDLDNTLYDWLGYFAPALRGMCVRLSELTGVSTDVLYDDFREVFSSHGTVEYTYALQEMSSIRRLHPGWQGAEVVNHYRSALDVFQHRRRRFLRLYAGVVEGIKALRSLNIRCVAVTDAHRFHAANRLRQLRVDKLLAGLACRPDHADVPDDELSQIRRFPASQYSASIAEYVLPEDLRKPDPQVLLWLMKELSVTASQCAYVGDNLVKDILMAQDAKVIDCWAAYGVRYNPLDMATLVRVTHWSNVAVESALRATPERLGVNPTFTARSFEDVVDFVTGVGQRQRTTVDAADQYLPSLGMDGLEMCDA